MNKGLLTLLALIAVPIYILLFWNFVRSIMVMGKTSIGWEVVGFLFSPIAQIIFHLSNGSMLSEDDNRIFKIYYLSIGLAFIFSIVLSVVVPTLLPINNPVEDSTIIVESTTVASGYMDNTQQSPITPVKPQETNGTHTGDLDESYQNIIDSSHPDARSIVASREFSSWLQSLQPNLNSKFNRILSKGNAKEVIYMLDEFKKYKKARQYESDIEYKEVENIKQPVVTYSNPSNTSPERTAEQQMAANKKTMQVFIESEALDKKRSLVRQGYTNQQAEEYIVEWKQQRINKL